MNCHFFLTKIKAILIQISYINFLKVHEFVFLNRNLVRKVVYFLIYFNRLYWTHILRSSPFQYNHGEVCFSTVIYSECHEYYIIKNFKNKYGTNFSNRNQLGPPQASILSYNADLFKIYNLYI